MRKYIITGASGSGKTTVINLLAKKGFSTVQEASRLISKEYNLPPGSKRQKLIFSKQKYLEAHISNTTTFLDRSIIDANVYAKFYGTKQQDIIDYIRCAKYSQTVFLLLLPEKNQYPLREESYTQSKQIEKMLQSEYITHNFFIREIPYINVEERVDIILQAIKNETYQSRITNKIRNF